MSKSEKLEEGIADPNYTRSRIAEADKYRDRYAHMALKCDALEKRTTRYRSALERIRDGDWNWPKTARDIAAEALEEEDGKVR